MDLLPESMTVIILARLQIKDISRIKLVCKEWKSLLESSYFRDVYRTINLRNLSSPWSILYRDKFSTTGLEFFSERWGFTQSIGSCVSRFLDEVKAVNKSSRVGALTITDGLILLDMSTKSGPDTFCVANLMVRQLIKIPQPPDSYQNGYKYQGVALVTNMYKGDLLGYKVVRYGLSYSGDNFYFQLYSSDSGYWTFHFVGTKRHINNRLPSNTINLNGSLHWLCRDDTQALVSYDFYALTGVCRVISLPERSDSNFAATLTISCGSLMYMNTNSGRQLNQQLKIWRLKKYTSSSLKGSWKLVWDLKLGLCLATEPVAMHPFLEEIIYLVTRQTDYSETHANLVSGNLQTKKFQLHEDWNQKHREFEDYKSHLFHQFMFPQRLGSIPVPPGCTLVTLRH